MTEPRLPAAYGNADERGGPLAAFDGVRRGDAAPAWVADGIRDRWDLPGSAAIRLIVLSENVTFRVEEPAIVVRLSRPDNGFGVEEVRSEFDWVAALADAGVPTAAPVPPAEGGLVATLRDETGGAWLATATEYVDGAILEELPGFAGHATEIGALTARLHAHARSWRRPAGFRRIEWDVDDMVGEAARWGDWRAARLGERERDLLEGAERAAKAVLFDAGRRQRTPDRWGLIHADLRPSNLIAGPDGRLTVIDFDDCGDGWFRYDFAAALTFYEHREVARELAAGWIEGYRPALQWADLDEACAWSMIRRLTMLGWQQTHRADALPPDLWAEYQPGTLDVAAAYLADPRTLVR